MKELLNNMNNEQLAIYLNQYLRDIECSLDDNSYLNQFYVMLNNNDNYQLLREEFNINTIEQIDESLLLVFYEDELIKPMKVLLKNNSYGWVVCSYSVNEYLDLINENRYEIIKELIKHNYFDENC